MASQVNLQCLAAPTGVLSVGRTAMATEDRIADPRLFSTMSENNLLSTKKCDVTGEQQPSTSSTPFECDSHEVRDPLQTLQLNCMHEFLEYYY